VVRYVRHHRMRHPAELGEAEINAFLTHLAVQGKVAASTQNQALAALLFLYRHVLQREVGGLGEVVRARRARRLPVVLSRDEVRWVLGRLDGDRRLVAAMLYGAGSRLMECLRLRVQDVDVERREIMVRDGKGARDRMTMLPASLRSSLVAHLGEVERMHRADLTAGWGACAVADRAGSEVPERAGRVALAVGVPPGEPLGEPNHEGRGSPSRRRVARAEGGAGGGGGCGVDEAGYLPQPEALVRHAYSRGWVRHSDGAGAARTQRRPDDDDLHPRAEPWPGGCAESGGRVAGGRRGRRIRVSCRHEANGAGRRGGYGVGGVVRRGAFCGPVGWLGSSAGPGKLC
jgi:hypothetical protein